MNKGPETASPWQEDVRQQASRVLGAPPEKVRIVPLSKQPFKQWNLVAAVATGVKPTVKTHAAVREEDSSVRFLEGKEGKQVLGRLAVEDGLASADHAWASTFAWAYLQITAEPGEHLATTADDIDLDDEEHLPESVKLFAPRYTTEKSGSRMEWMSWSSMNGRISRWNVTVAPDGTLREQREITARDIGIFGPLK